ncbi:MAG TPA: Uma2 family endonuclease [Desulfotomaculum sp.]|nr:Uma2 family endonuclease [Desulfotomaculum sp.]
MGISQICDLDNEAERAAPPGRMSFEEFLAWCDEDTWAEWVDGEVVVLTPANMRHQDIGLFLAALISEFAVSYKLGKVVVAPFLVRLPEPLSRGREPDILYITNERISILKETYCDGAPDLIVEVTSPESFARDRGEKYVEYEAAGVREYWLIDPDRRQAEFYRLGQGGRYRSIPLDERGVYVSAVLPGLWLKVDWLWEGPLPSVITCLKEMGVV